ncbi:MAG TPA: DNA recombination protein RmuC [Acholeplasmataceae bacterium]|nr:DNA recombination protein RmuC [Acholeplasmataceae bacterium]
MTTTEILIITGIVLVIVLLTILMIILLRNSKAPTSEIKGRHQQEILSKIEHLQTAFKAEIEKQNLQSKTDIEKTFMSFKEAVSTKLNTDLQTMNEKVETRLKEGFQSSDQLFKNMVEKLAIIDTTQKNIENLSGHVTDLKTYLSDKKQRGMYGEVQLYQILENVFGENNQALFTKQHTLSNGTKVDALVYGSDQALNIPIDSKFSLENYIRMNDETLSEASRKEASKLFEQNIKKHINDIASKYIIKNETTNYALMFIPSEAVFSEIQANYVDLILYAQQKNVWLTSPTTLVYMLTMILLIYQDVEKEKHAEKMLLEIDRLFDDFRLFFARWDTFKKEIKKLVDSIDSLDKPMERLNKKVYKIKTSDFDNLDNDA